MYMKTIMHIHTDIMRRAMLLCIWLYTDVRNNQVAALLSYLYIFTGRTGHPS